MSHECELVPICYCEYEHHRCHILAVCLLSWATCYVTDDKLLIDTQLTILFLNVFDELYNCPPCTRLIKINTLIKICIKLITNVIKKRNKISEYFEQNFTNALFKLRTLSIK